MKIEGRPKLELEMTIRLNESEARALDALAGYGDDSFVKAFYSLLPTWKIMRPACAHSSRLFARKSPAF